MFALLGFGLFQKDMKTIFLNGHLEEETYMVNLLILYQKDKRTEFVFLRDPPMVSSSLLECGVSGSTKLFSFMA